MSWLRIDDKFPQHPKFDGWSSAQRWAWLELMAYCARYETNGNVPKSLSLLPRSVNRSLLNKAVTSGWIDVAEDGTETIHDWEKYNPRDPLKTERQARWRRRKGDGDVDGDVDADVDGTKTPNVDGDVDALARAPAGASPSPNNPTPSEVLLGDGRSEETGAAAPATPNGAAPLNETKLTALTEFVKREWHHYPNLDVLRDELTDRGATPDQADRIIDAEKAARMTTSA